MEQNKESSSSNNVHQFILSPRLFKDYQVRDRLDAREASRVILAILAAGLVITSIFIAPGAAGTVAKLLIPFQKERWRRRRVINRLTRLKYVRLANRSGQSILELTHQGKKVAKRISLDLIEVNQPNKWDRKWRIVVFDIPEKKRVVRDILRTKLKGLGFREFQKSIWAIPWPCRPEIEYIRELYGLERNLGFWETPDGPEFFNLKQIFKNQNLT